MNPETARQWWELVREILESPLGALVIVCVIFAAWIWNSWRLEKIHQQNLRAILRVRQINAELALKQQRPSSPASDREPGES